MVIDFSVWLRNRNAVGEPGRRWRRRAVAPRFEPTPIAVEFPSTVMKDAERAFLDLFLANFSARLARDMRSALADEALLDEDDDRLTPVARAWAEGYTASRLSTVRGAATGNSGLSDEDLAAVHDVIVHNEDQITAELYS